MKHSEDLAVAAGDRRGVAWPILLVLGLLLPLVMAFDVQLNAPVVDSFHEGEYLGSIESLRQFFAEQASFPILIHGAMDYLPALWASQVGRDDSVIVLTRFVNVAVVAFCWIIWMGLACAALRRNSQAVLWSSVFIVLFLLMANAAGTDPVHKQQAFLGTRDAFLLLSLWTGLHACDGGGAGAVLASLATGLFAALSLYWSYDRGIISAVWLIVLALGLALRGGHRLALGMLVAYAASLWLVSSIGVAGSLADNWRNIVYWLANTGDVWRMPFSEKLPALPGALAMVAFGLPVCLHAARTALRDWRARRVPAMAGLVAIQLVFFTKLYSLPGFPTTYYYIWPSILLLVLTPPTSSALASLDVALRHLSAAIWSGEGRLGLRWGALALAGLFLSNAVVSSALAARSVLRPASDRALLATARYGLDDLKGVDTACIFQWSNEGVFAFAQRKPHCLPYTYAVYISRSEEASALASLQANPPGVVVYDSPNWSMRIYERQMRERLPSIDRFISEHYNFRHTASGYVFGVLKTTPTKPAQQ